MSRRLAVFAIVLSVILVLSGGCAKKNPTTPKSYDPSHSGGSAPGADLAGYDADSPRGDVGTSELDSPGLLGTVYFDFDRYDLLPESRRQLDQNAEYLLANPMALVTIEGHCDERGTNEYNIALGARRAETARRYLLQLGVEAGRLRTVSFGEERPTCTLSNESCWRSNRRAHFMVTGSSKLG